MELTLDITRFFRVVFFDLSMWALWVCVAVYSLSAFIFNVFQLLVHTTASIYNFILNPYSMYYIIKFMCTVCVCMCVCAVIVSQWFFASKSINANTNWFLLISCTLYLVYMRQEKRNVQRPKNKLSLIFICNFKYRFQLSIRIKSHWICDYSSFSRSFDNTYYTVQQFWSHDFYTPEDTFC